VFRDYVVYHWGGAVLVLWCDDCGSDGGRVPLYKVVGVLGGLAAVFTASLFLF